MSCSESKARTSEFEVQTLYKPSKVTRSRHLTFFSCFTDLFGQTWSLSNCDRKHFPIINADHLRSWDKIFSVSNRLCLKLGSGQQKTIVQDERIIICFWRALINHRSCFFLFPLSGHWPYAKSGLIARLDLWALVCLLNIGEEYFCLIHCFGKYFGIVWQ